jgi:hypothetical protein
VNPSQQVLDAAAEALIVGFRAEGVMQIRWVPGATPGVCAWLCTQSDRDRDALRLDPTAVARAVAVLSASGFTSEEYLASGVHFESEETVARDYESSWFNAMR